MNQLKALFLFILLACSLNINAQRIKGSDTVLPVSQETAEIFMKDDPDRRVTVTGGGTGVGISALMDNTTDIAMASRPIKFSEKMKLKAAKQEVEEVIIAYDALAVIVNPSNPVSQLTRQQLEAIFRGKITNCIIRKSKFPQNPKRSVRFSGKRTKRSVQKRKARNTQKAETKVL